MSITVVYFHRVAEILDYTADELTGMNMYTLCHGEDVGKLRKCHLDREYIIFTFETFAYLIILIQKHIMYTQIIQVPAACVFILRVGVFRGMDFLYFYFYCNLPIFFFFLTEMRRRSECGTF